MGAPEKQCRKWQITINNPGEHGFDHEAIKQIMSGVRGKSLYWCMCDEQGDECETLHTHVFIFRTSAFTVSQIDSLFPKCHQEACYGSTQENRAYVLKYGDKFNKDETGHYDYTDTKGNRHIGVNFSDTFWESGDCPDEHQGISKSAELIVELIRTGADNKAIVDIVPAAYEKIEKIERTRSMFRDSHFADSWRDLTVTYIFGKTGAGKTRSVMDKYGYSNCYRVTDYKHPFDTYDGQDVLIFEEFRSQVKIADMLNYLDGYPLLLPCRYFNRQACFTKVFLITNVPLEYQYQNCAKESIQAFRRRVHLVSEYGDTGKIDYESVDDYLLKNQFQPYEESRGYEYG